MKVGRPQTATPEVAERPRRGPWLVQIYRSQLGKKYAMAISGIVLFGWILLHMVGNLKFFQGPSHLNDYSHWLRTVGTPAAPHNIVLWGVRLTLALATVVHIGAAVQLTLQNRKARQDPTLTRNGYEVSNYVAANYASRTMRWSGIIVLAFVVYHLLDFTFGQANPDFVAGDPYHNTVAAFSVWWIGAVYILANVLLGVHLYHGLWSLFQSMGWNAPRFNHWRRAFAYTFAAVVTLGFISVPIAVMAGMGR